MAADEKDLQKSKLSKFERYLLETPEQLLPDIFKAYKQAYVEKYESVTKQRDEKERLRLERKSEKARIRIEDKNIKKAELENLRKRTLSDYEVLYKEFKELDNRLRNFEKTGYGDLEPEELDRYDEVRQSIYDRLNEAYPKGNIPKGLTKSIDQSESPKRVWRREFVRSDRGREIIERARNSSYSTEYTINKAFRKEFGKEGPTVEERLLARKRKLEASILKGRAAKREAKIERAEEAVRKKEAALKERMLAESELDVEGRAEATSKVDVSDKIPNDYKVKLAEVKEGRLSLDELRDWALVRGYDKLAGAISEGLKQAETAARDLSGALLEEELEEEYGDEDEALRELEQEGVDESALEEVVSGEDLLGDYASELQALATELGVDSVVDVLKNFLSNYGLSDYLASSASRDYFLKDPNSIKTVISQWLVDPAAQRKPVKSENVPRHTAYKYADRLYSSIQAKALAASDFNERDKALGAKYLKAGNLFRGGLDDPDFINFKASFGGSSRTTRETITSNAPSISTPSAASYDPELSKKYNRLSMETAVLARTASQTGVRARGAYAALARRRAVELESSGVSTREALRASGLSEERERRSRLVEEGLARGRSLRELASELGTTREALKSLRYRERKALRKAVLE